MPASGIATRGTSLRITTSHGSSAAAVVGIAVGAPTVTAKPDCVSALSRYFALAGVLSMYSTFACGATTTSRRSSLLAASGSRSAVTAAVSTRDPG